MFSERNRLATFDDCPNLAEMPGKASLAKAGYFYKNQNTQCAFCLHITRNWKISDNVALEHRDQFPNCPNVHGCDPRNIPLHGGTTVEDQDSIQSSSPAALDQVE